VLAGPTPWSKMGARKRHAHTREDNDVTPPKKGKKTVEQPQSGGGSPNSCALPAHGTPVISTKKTRGKTPNVNTSSYFDTPKIIYFYLNLALIHL